MTLVLLALILPLQSFAAAWSCSAHDAGLTAVHRHCANESGKAHGGGEQQHHCGTCCAAAIALMPFLWTASPPAKAEVSLTLPGPAPRVALDRLDRPPRLV